MEFITACDNLTGHLNELDPRDPLVPAALTFVIRPWLASIHDADDVMRWGLFGIAVQAVTDRLWPGPPAIAVAPTLAPVPGPDLDEAVARLVCAAADLLHRASRQRADSLAWEYAAASTELLDAARELT